VIECRAQPVGGGVAAGAILRESLRRVRRVVGPIVVCLVTVPAGRTRQAVVAVDVALRALQTRVRARQRETGRRVVEGGARPVGDGGAMTERAILRETRGGMRRIARAIVIGLVTIPARGAVQRVVIVNMARRALLRGVHSHQRKAGGCVIERRAQPVGRGMASRAVLREVAGFVRWIIRPVIIRLVAVPARAATQGVIVVYVALRALQTGMRPGQREPGGRVIERRARPIRNRSAVAEGAILRETGRGVRRVVGSVEISQMAIDTGRAAQSVIVVHVAGGALLGRMQTYQREPGSCVIEDRAQPVRSRVAA